MSDKFENILPEGERSYEDYVNAVMTLREASDAVHWTCGDVINDAKDKFGKEVAAKIATDAGLEPATVTQWAWVSEKFPDPEMRNTGLTWSHYRATAGTENPMLWVNEAVRNDWTVSKLREEIKRVQDATSVAEGRQCSICGDPLPEDGAYFIRYANEKTCVCSAKCGVEWFKGRFDNEQSQLGAAKSEIEIPLAAAPVASSVRAEDIFNDEVMVLQ